MSRSGNVYYKNKFAGVIKEDENGFSFQYDKEYLNSSQASPVSLTMPLREAAYENNVMLPFFDGLIPEGWLLDIASENWKIDPRDRMSLLLSFCKDCIGAVSVLPSEKNEKSTRQY